MAKQSEWVPGLRAILVGAAPLSPEQLKRALKEIDFNPEDILVGVDGGVLTLKSIGLAPHVAVGDWDSAPQSKLIKSIPKVSLPKSKDRSDLYYALRVAKSAGATEYQTIGATGGRADHELSVWYELAEFAEEMAQEMGGAAVSLSGPTYNSFFLAHGKVLLPVRKGGLVSILPIGGAAQGVTLKGLKYPLKNAHLECTSRGMSNIAQKDAIEVEVKIGRLMILLPGPGRDA